MAKCGECDGVNGRHNVDCPHFGLEGTDPRDRNIVSAARKREIAIDTSPAYKPLPVEGDDPMRMVWDAFAFLPRKSTP